MVEIVVGLVAVALGVWLRRWPLLAVPPLVVIALSVILTSIGIRVDPDNPAVFILMLTEVSLAVGVAMGRRGARRPETLT